MKWERFYKQIPSKVKIGKSVYEILWTEQFTDKHQYGETRFSDNKQIVIKLTLSPKEALITYWHEVLHAASEEFEVGLTEGQVLKLEKLLPYLFKDNNFLKTENKKNEVKSRKRRNSKRIR